MSFRLVALPIPWQRGIPAVDAAVGAELDRWRGTPYVPGQRTPKAGTDCVGFALGFAAALRRRPVAPSLAVPPDAALHDPKRVFAALRALLRAHAPIARARAWAEPGDLLLTSPSGAGPSHAMIVGAEPYTLWHATQPEGVVRTGWAIEAESQASWALYRCGDKAGWALCDKDATQ